MNKLGELLKDKNFAEEFFKQETAEAAQKFLASKGVEVSTDELEALRKALVAKIESSNEEEMSEDDLDKVAGGANVFKTVNNFLNDYLPDIQPRPWVVNLTRRRW